MQNVFSYNNNMKLQKLCLSQIQFIDLSSFMTRLLSNLVDNLAQEIHKIKYKHGHDNKK